MYDDIDEKSFGLLMENGGLVIDDIREVEDSIAQLWQDMCHELDKDNSEVPYIFDFKAF